MSEPIERIVKTNGISLSVVEQGQGPLVLLCHGFSEISYSWRHQINSLAEAGFHVVAPDMRGYGKSDRPEVIDQYTIFHLVGDLVGLLDSLEAPRPSLSAMIGARLSLGRPHVCARIVSAQSSALACHSGRGVRRARPA